MGYMGYMGCMSYMGQEGLVHQLLLDLLEALAFGFGQPGQDACESNATDGRINPKGNGWAEDGVKDGKSVREQETGDPEEADRDGHGGAANTVGEDRRDDDPRDRRQGHRIGGDGGEHQREEQEIGRASCRERVW